MRRRIRKEEESEWERERERNFISVGWTTLVGTEGTALIDPRKKLRSHWPATSLPFPPARHEFGTDSAPRLEFRVSVARKVVVGESERNREKPERGKRENGEGEKHCPFLFLSHSLSLSLRSSKWMRQKRGGLCEASQHQKGKWQIGVATVCVLAE